MSETRPESFDAGLAAAFGAATKDNYLGNPECVESLLRVMLADSLALREQVQLDKVPESDLARLGTEILRKTARIFLGRDADFVPVVGWNQPGGVDEHLTKELRLPDKPAEDRVVNALWQLVKEICGLVHQEEQGALPENTRWQMDEAIAQMTRSLLGIPQPSDEPTTPPEPCEEEDDDLRDVRK